MKHYCASAFVVDIESKKLLLVHHKDLNKWVQPGGHIEENETPEEAAIRETFEETGLDIELIGPHFPRKEDFIRPLGIQKNVRENGDHIDITYIAVPKDKDKIKVNDESYDIKWFTIEELDSIDVFEDIKITFKYILEHLKTDN